MQIVMMSKKVIKHSGRIGDVVHEKALEIARMKRHRCQRSRSKRGFKLQCLVMMLKENTNLDFKVVYQRFGEKVMLTVRATKTYSLFKLMLPAISYVKQY